MSDWELEQFWRSIYLAAIRGLCANPEVDDVSKPALRIANAAWKLAKDRRDEVRAAQAAEGMVDAIAFRKAVEG